MRRSLLFLLLASVPALASAKTGTSIYVCAHPDDCILFMNPNLMNDITRDADKVVSIYFTSGDAGQPFSEEGSAASYPYVREQATIDATQWMVDANKDKITATLETDMVDAHGHAVERVSYGNTVSYFLRLPDGNFTGTGFALYHNQSLHKLKAGTVDRMTPLDGSPAYNGWQDVVGVVGSIIGNEAGSEPNVTLHIQDPDTHANTDDHSDHTAGAEALLEAIANPDRCYTIYKHIDYAIAQKPLNLEGLALQDKSASFAVLTATERHFLDHADWNEGHTAYLTRNYYTTMTLPAGCSK